MADENKLEGGVSFDTTDAKASITELNRAIKVLDSGFKASAASLGDWTKTTEGNESRMKSLADIMDLQRQKIANLTGEYTRIAAEQGASSRAAQDLEIRINKEKEALGRNETAVRDCANRLDELGKDATGAADDVAHIGDAAAKAAGQTSMLRSAVGKLSEGLKASVAAAAKAAAAALAAVGTAAVAATKSAFDMAVAAGEAADALLTTSAQTGVSTKRLQEWDYAARFIDTDVSTMTSSMAKMVKQMGMAATGSKASAANFKRLGVDIYDSNGKLRDSEAVFADAIDALGKIGSESERDAKAMMIFGKSAQELNPLIKAGGDQLRALAQEAQQMGVVMSDSALSAMGSFDDSMQRAQAAAGGMKNAIAANVIPAFQPLVETATSAMSQVATALQDGLQPGEMQGLVSGLVSQFSSAIKGIVGMISQALPLIVQAISAIVNGIVQALPGLLNTLLPAAMNLLQSVLNAIMGNLDPLISFVVQLIGALANFLVQNAPKLMQAATQLIMALVKGLTDHLADFVPVAVEMIVQLIVGLMSCLAQLTGKGLVIIAALIEGLMKVDWGKVGLDLIQGLVNGLGLAVTSLWDSIVGVFQHLWNGIKAFFGIHSPSTLAAGAGGQIMAGLVDGMQEAQPGAQKNAEKAFSGVWDAAQDGMGVGAGGGRSESAKAGSAVMNGLADGIASGQREAVASSRSAAQAMISAFRNALAINGSISVVFLSVGRAISAGISRGILSGVNAIRAAAVQAARSAVSAAKAELGIASPSKVAEDMIGKQWGAGVAIGIAQSASLIGSAITAMSAGMQSVQGSVARQAVPAFAMASPAAPLAFDEDGFIRKLIASRALQGDVYMDAQRVGRIVAPTVSREQGRAYVVAIFVAISVYNLDSAASVDKVTTSE